MQDDPPGRASDPILEQHPGSAEVAESARRLGPLPYSSLGPGSGPPVPPAEELAPWVAAAIDEIWLDEGRPDPFTYVDVGAGDGRRAAELLRLGPRCLDALRVVLVEPERAARDGHAQRLSLESPAFILGPVAPSDDPDEGSRPVPGVGPLVTSLAELPELPGTSVGVVIGFGWLGRQPADRYLWSEGVWWEIRLGADPSGARPLVEIPVPAAGERADELDALVGRRLDGARYAVAVGARAWLSEALSTAEAGWLLALDRWTGETEPLGGRGSPAVALNQMASIRRPSSGPTAAAGSMNVVRWRLG